MMSGRRLLTRAARIGAQAGESKPRYGAATVRERFFRQVLILLALPMFAVGQNAPPKAAPAPRKPAVTPAVPNYNELKFPELRPAVPPPVESVTFPNGMRLLLLENHELPVISGTVLVRTGSAFDPPDKTGLAALTAHVIVEGGTNTHPGDDLDRRFHDLGAELTCYISDSLLSFSFSGVKENGDAVLDALRDGLISPEFAQERIDLLKTRSRLNIAHRNDDGEGVLRREFTRILYGAQSPYGRQVEYTNLDRINRSDLVAFHQRYFFPKNVTVALSGDFDSVRMRAWVESVFRDWKTDQSPAPEFPPAVKGSAPGKFLAIKKDTNHGFFAVGEVAVEQTDKDLPALEIAAEILGGGARARLNDLLHGDVDGLTAVLTPGFGHPGIFQINGTIANQFVTTRVLRTVYDELGKIRALAVTEQELEIAKTRALNRFAFRFAGRQNLLPQLAENRYFSLPDDYMTQHQKALGAVTRDDVLRVARAWLDPARMTTLVVANPTAFEEPLDTVGGTPAGIVDLTIPAPKVEASAGDAASQGRGKQLLQRAQQAMGGADKLAAVKDYVQELTYQFDPSAGGAKVEMTERWVAPNYLRQDTNTPNGQLSVFCDGKIGWITAGRNSGALTGVQLKQMQNDLFRTIFPLLLSDRNAGRNVTALDEQTVEISDADGHIAKLIFDGATSLPKTALYDAITADGAFPVIESYADYRDIDGVKIPFRISIDLAGQKFQDVTIRSMRINAGLKLEDLEKRP